MRSARRHEVDRRQLDVPWQVIDIGAIALDTRDLIYVIHYNYISVLCRFGDISNYYFTTNFRRVT